MKAAWERLVLWAKTLWTRVRVRGAQRRRHVTAVNLAIERVVEQANPRLRGLMGYRKALFPVVEEGLAYSEELAARLSGPVRLDRAAWCADPQVSALFADVDALRRVLSGPAVRAWAKERPLETGDGYGILLAWPQVRNQLGVEMVGETLRRDVRQTTLGFADAELVLLGSDLEEVRRKAVGGVMDALAGEAIRALTERETRIAEIEERLRILRLKRKVLNPAGQGLDFLSDGSTANLPEYEALGLRIAELEQELEVASAGLKTPGDYLLGLVEALKEPRGRIDIRLERVTLDRMNIVRQGAAEEGATEVEFACGYRGERRGRVLLLVQFPRGEMIQEAERVAELDRFLAS
jgi:hypothetical protein